MVHNPSETIHKKRPPRSVINSNFETRIRINPRRPNHSMHVLVLNVAQYAVKLFVLRDRYHGNNCICPYLTLVSQVVL